MRSTNYKSENSSFHLQHHSPCTLQLISVGNDIIRPDMACPESTYAALLLLLLEGWFRWVNPASFQDIALRHFEPEYYSMKGPIFMSFSVACLLFSMIFVLYLYDCAIFKLPCTQNFLPYLYMFDSLGAVLLGYSLYFSDTPTLYVSLTILTNFLMINALSKVFAMKKPHGLVSCHLHVVCIKISTHDFSCFSCRLKRQQLH